MWGGEFIDLYLECCVPNQMAYGNLPALPPGSRYRIFTSAGDVAHLEAHPRLDAVRRLLPVDIVSVDFTDADRHARDGERWNTHKRMIACHRHAAADAGRDGRALLYMAPDFVLAEGTFAALVRRHAAGARAVMTMNLRLDREAAVRALAAAGNPAPPPRQLVALAMQHLHPWTQSLMADSTQTSDNPASVYWPVRTGDTLDGVLVRSLFLHPMLVDPVRRDHLPRGPIDSHYVRDACPDVTQCCVIDDSDELVVFELSPVGREIGRGIDRVGVSPLRLAGVSARCDAHQLSYWRRSIRLHAAPLDARWNALEHEAERFARAFARWRPFGPALRVMFEWRKWLTRQQDDVETVIRKGRRRWGQVVYRARRQSAAVVRETRKAVRPPVTAKQATRPLKVGVHALARTWKLSVKRMRRFYLSAPTSK